MAGQEAQGNSRFFEDISSHSVILNDFDVHSVSYQKEKKWF